MKDLKYDSWMYKITIPFKRLWFKYKLNNGELIKVDYRHRGIGKTTMLIEFALKNKLPIVVGNQLIANSLKSNGVEIIRMAKNFSLDIEGKIFPDGILIDESLDPDMIHKLVERNIKIRGGFLQK